MSDLLAGLNPQQRQIVMDTDGNILTLAGAGSGKTRVLTHRIAYLLKDCGIRPWRILAVTFTNKAAKEMKHRVVEIVGEDARDVWVGTFHSTCVRILTRFGSEIGLANNKFTIIDDKEQKKIVNEAIAACGFEYEADAVLNVISDAKNRLLTSSGLMEIAQSNQEKDMANIYEAFEEKKNELGYVDFDDLILKAVHLLQVSKEARDHYQHQFQYVLTDETQDTNIAQFTLLQLLSGHHGNLFAVGDVDQSIYKWRGAQISNIINFGNYFPHPKMYRLEQNYRSTQVIVEAANALIHNNQERLEKTSFTQNGKGDPIILHRADNEAREADFVADVIKRNRMVEGRPYSDFAILYRTNRQSRAIESALVQHKIPYQVLNGHAFYERKEIKDIVAYLRTIDNSVDALAFKRVINVPKRGIGDTTIDRIQDYADDCGIPFTKALINVADVPKVNKKTQEKILSFLEVIKSFVDYAESEGFKVVDLIQRILNETGYRQSLIESGKEEDETRLENLDELLNVAGKWDEGNVEGKGLSDFLTETTLVSDIDGMESDNLVTLLTVHSSKGLEFPIVNIVGLEESIFPHGRSLRDDSELEEERRLMYVALTRAEQRLYLSHCEKRYEYGSKDPVRSRPSRFLAEIPKHLIRRL